MSITYQFNLLSLNEHFGPKNHLNFFVAGSKEILYLLLFSLPLKDLQMKVLWGYCFTFIILLLSSEHWGYFVDWWITSLSLHRIISLCSSKGGNNFHWNVPWLQCRDLCFPGQFTVRNYKPGQRILTRIFSNKDFGFPPGRCRPGWVGEFHVSHLLRAHQACSAPKVQQNSGKEESLTCQI